jgi:hypothetical protein
MVAEGSSIVFSDEQVAILGCTREKAVLVKEPEAGEYNPPRLLSAAKDRSEKEKMAPRRIKIQRKREEVTVQPTESSPLKGDHVLEETQTERAPSPTSQLEKEQVPPKVDQVMTSADIFNDGLQMISPEEGRSAAKRRKVAEESAGFTGLDQFCRSPTKEAGEGSMLAGGHLEHTSPFTPIFDELRVVPMTEEMRGHLRPLYFRDDRGGQYVPDIEVGVNESAVTAKTMDGSTLGMRALRALNLPGDGCPDTLITPFSDADNALLLVSVLLIMLQCFVL